MENLQNYIQQGVAMVIDYAPRVLLALITLWIGLRIIASASKLMMRSFERQKVDESLRPFLTSLLTWVLKAVLFISVASMIGIQTTSFVAILGAAGLAVGLALQGTLANFAGGVLIMIFKPFRVGHLIKAQGQLGTVEEIQIFVTKLVTFENKTIYLPNGVLSNGDITNFSEKGSIRVDLELGISYQSNIAAAKQALLDAMKAHPAVLAEPAPYVGVAKLADSSITLAVKPWCHPDDYWTVFFDIQEQSKLALDAAGVKIPFPQRDVHVFQH